MAYAAPNLVIEMASGVVLSFPVKDNPRLAKGSPAQLRNVEVSPYGLHWPELDEDFYYGEIRFTALEVWKTRCILPMANPKSLKASVAGDPWV